VNVLLEVRQATVRYALAGGRALAAVDGVSLSLDEGEILGLVGESGCGKSSLGRAILGLARLASGQILWKGRRIDTLPRRAFRALRGDMQLVFQDPHACFDPRMTLAESIGEPLRALATGLDDAGRAARVESALAEVGLDREIGARYPHQLSGGQLQRAGIARALVVAPRFMVCDEPVSALDVSVQGQIVNLLARIRRERRLACLFISHNLAVVARLSERILVMYRGRIVESASRDALLRAPRHPYTRLLLDSVPDPHPAAARKQLAAVRESPAPVADETADGCPFAPRCPWALARCRASAPTLQRLPDQGLVACHRAVEWPDGLAPAAP
jgi:oligopeptide/dipeptide ABC transporter ATP-binding protein